MTRRIHLRRNTIGGALLAVLLISGEAFSAKAQSPRPALFFTDLQSGPNTGGETQGAYAGAYVTLYGNYFGAAQGASSVTLNGSSCMRVVSWGTTYMWYQKLVVQLGPGCTSGSLVVTTTAGASNALPFTVRAGNIYCVSTAGNDSNSGKFPSCWSTAANAASVMKAGDTVYIGNGVINTSVQSYSAVVNVTGSPGGTSSNPIAFVAYPAAIATIGDINNSPYAMRVPQIGVNPAYYVIAGLTLRGQEALEIFGSDHWWLVGNDMSCTASGFGCIHADQSANLFLYGNNVHNISGNVKLYHAVYFTTNTNHVWFGWNTVDPDPNHTGAAGCRGVQFYSTGGSDQYDLHIHDNVIRNTICDGLNFATVDADHGTVEAYNNVIYHAGTGPDPQGQLSDYACIYANASGNPTNPVLVYNNSMYDCGQRGSPGNSGAINAAIPVQLRNNAVQSTTSGEAYINGPCSNVSGANNDWYGNGSAPCSSTLTNNLNVSPGFTRTGGTISLVPAKGSALIDAGMSIPSLAEDITGVSRPQGKALDIGAYEVFSSGAILSACDLNQDGKVDATDVQSAINQSIGIAGCISADLAQAGVCNVVDVQRVVNASLGLSCRLGP